MEEIDYIVIGQGIAGSLLAYELCDRGLNIKIIDNAHGSSSSTVAAGIINPITGFRLTKDQKIDQFLPAARLCYKELESQFHVNFFNQREILRLFKNDYELSQYQKRKSDPTYAQYLGEHFAASTFGDVLRDERGGFIIKEAANVNTKVFLSTLRDFFKTNNSLIEHAFDYQEIKFENSHVIYDNIIKVRAKKIIFCEGYKVIENPWFKDLPWKLAKGEILTLKIQDPKAPLPDKIINCGKWLMPLSNGLYQAGASYDWDHIDNQPTETGRQKILNELRNYILVSDKLEVVAQEAGVRPCTRDGKPYIGLHPVHSYLGLFNGFGSKAILTAPYYAKQFADFLENDGVLDEDVLIHRG